MADEIGRIKSDMAADLLAVEYNPLERINDIGNITAVYRGGQALDPESLFKGARGYFDEKMDDPIIHNLRNHEAGELSKHRQHG